MTRRFLVHKHPHVITATEIQIKDSTGVFDPVLRFGSLAEVIDHFSSSGASSHALDALRDSVNSTGMATLVFSDKAKP
jgi:hypothetical protein